MRRILVGAIALVIAFTPGPARAAHSDVAKETSWNGLAVTDDNGSIAQISELVLRDDHDLTLRVQIEQHDGDGNYLWGGYIEFHDNNLAGQPGVTRLRQRQLFTARIQFSAPTVCLWTADRPGARTDGCYEPRGDGLEVDVTLVGVGPIHRTVYTDPQTGVTYVDRSRDATASGRISFDDEGYPGLNWGEFPGYGQLYIERVRA